MHHVGTSPRVTGLLALLLLAAPALGTAQDRLGNSSRDRWQRVPAVFQALGVAPGKAIADVGAGRGYFTDRLSEAVGPGGRVFAVDIDGARIRQLRDWAQRAGRGNVVAIHSEPDDPMLPADSLDGVLIVNAYHEMNEFEAMLAGIQQALKPGGRLVIIDEQPRDTGVSRARQTAGHDIAMGLVAGDLERAGYRIVERRPDFIERGSRDRTRHHWMLVAERPRRRQR